MIVLALFVFVPLRSSHKQEFKGAEFMDGVFIGEVTIELDVAKNRCLFKEDSITGRFRLKRDGKKEELYKISSSFDLKDHYLLDGMAILENGEMYHLGLQWDEDDDWVFCAGALSINGVRIPVHTIIGTSQDHFLDLEYYQKIMERVNSNEMYPEITLPE